MDRLFTDSLTSGGLRRGDIFGVSGKGFLPLDIYQTDNEWVIRAGVPSVNPEQVEVTCVTAARSASPGGQVPREHQVRNYVMRENFYGAFSREISLPEETMCEQATAEFRNGMLVLTLPKAYS
jgi:HSP20 family protein